VQRRIIVGNFLITAGYFSILLGLTKGVSGGDIFLIIATASLALVHFIVVTAVFFRTRKNIIKCLIGILLGLLLAFIIYKILQCELLHNETKVTVMNIKLSAGLNAF